MQVPRRAALQVAALALLPALAPAQSIAPASPAPAEVLREFDSPRLQGSGRMRFLAFDLYEARLWTPAEFRPARYSEAAFALELNYLRSLSTEVLVEASVREMRRLGSLTSQREAIWTPRSKPPFHRSNRATELPACTDPDRVPPFMSTASCAPPGMTPSWAGHFLPSGSALPAASPLCARSC